MSEEQQNPTPAPVEPAVEPEAPAAEETDWKAESRKWEDRAKKNSDAAARLAELEEASKTEEQKRADEVAELRKKVTEYETAAQVADWKAEVSKETGVPVGALAGDTLEAIQAHADVLKPLITPSQQKAGPIPAMGRVPEARNMSLDDRIAVAQEAGDKAQVAELKALKLAPTQ